MIQKTLNTNEVHQFVMQTFGEKELTAFTTENIVLLLADNQKQQDNKKESAIYKLYGMFKNTRLLSSEDFANNKKIEKELEGKKFQYE